MADYATRRINMVDTQVRPSDVTRFPVIEAMLTIPREHFVPAPLRELAYAEEMLEITPGRVVLEPRSLGKLLDLLDLQRGEKVLHIGAGLGYGTAVLAALVEFVAAVEEDPDLAAAAEIALQGIGADNAAVLTGPLSAGAASAGPFDAILIDGGIEVLPPDLLHQLREGGRIAAIWMVGRGLGEGRIGIRTGDHISWRSDFNAVAPVLPGFTRQPVFTL